MTVKDDAANLAAASGAVVITNVMPEAAPSGGGLHPALAKRVEVAWKTDDPAQYSDVRRICSIPIAGPLTDAEVEEFSRRNVLAAAYESGFRLREGQARVVVFYDRYGGVFAPLPCSAGKTLASILVAERYWRRTAQKLLQAGTPDLPNRSLYLVPPEVYPQVMQQIGNRPPDIQWARARVPVTVPFVGLGGGMTQARREALATNYKRGCFVMPHSLMSARDGSKLLDLIEPGLLIVDEAHRFKNRSAARTKRLMSYVNRKLPQLVILSGSITNKSVKDYHHFLKPTLGVRSPLPHAPDLAYQWSEVVDTDADPSEDMKRPMAPLVDWAKFHFREEALKGLLPMDVSGFRRAHKLRMNTCPGVVAATDAGVPSTLIIATREVTHAVPGQQVALDALVRRVDDDWVTPNGDPIDHAIHKFKWLYELTAGFYYRLTWPVADEVAKRKNLSLVEAKDVVDRSIARHLAHGNYAKALRKWFADGSHQAGLDTPFLVGQDMARNGAKNVGQVLYDAWSAWKAAGVGVDGSTDDLVERDSQAVRVCDYKVRAARDWARALREQHGKVGGLLWIYHNEVGQWLYEVLKSDEALWADVPGGAHGPYGVLCAPAGEPHNRAIMDPSNSKKLVVASIVAHGTGKNLQAFEHQCVVQWPRSAGQAEQFLSRTHRTGQLADELRVDVLMAPAVKAAGGSEDYAGTDFDLKNLSACLRDATYVQQSTGSSQKVLIAQYDPLPRIYDQSVLNELGFQPKKLDAQGEKSLREKFG
ncbi:MAG: DEAD/DEAH box helicase family protein [Deltaproteobacteria bacterium]|nr:DEAD/DEAH box helicase family protein [Deltaproteobacteria bacterium]